MSAFSVPLSQKCLQAHKTAFRIWEQFLLDVGIFFCCKDKFSENIFFTCTLSVEISLAEKLLTARSPKTSAVSSRTLPETLGISSEEPWPIRAPRCDRAEPAGSRP